jgi:hypothetical protein
MPKTPSEQMDLLPVPTAKSARAELTDHTARQGVKKKAKDPARYDRWPNLGTETRVQVGEHWLPGVMGTREPSASGEAQWRVQLRPEWAEGLSESLKASLPKVVHVRSLDELRRPE